jgi:hypothetical protein
MSALIRPSEASDLASLAAALDAATPAERFAWVRSLRRGELYALYALAQGSRASVDDVTGAELELVVCDGRNGLPLFYKFRKVFSRIGGEVVGYNDGREIAGPLSPIAGWVTGPGHFTAYDVEGEIWVDYRKVPSARHPSFPPLIDNEHGLRALTFGNMVDVVRRVSHHVFVGDAFRNKPRPDPMPFMARIGSMFPTAPFAMCRRS